MEEANKSALPICEHLDWDSQFWGKRIARVLPTRLNAGAIEQAMHWCRNERVDCVYWLTDADDRETVRLAEQHGFMQTDVRLTFERKLNIPLPAAQPAPANSHIRLATQADQAALCAIASHSHTDTRFYYDAHFERERCNQLYETWITNSLNGFAQAVFVYAVDEQVVGYVTCHLNLTQDGHKETQLGLIAIHPAKQGLGLGKQLVHYFLAWSMQQNASLTTVVTQGRNIPAQKLYQVCGFATKSLQLWYHHWFIYD